MTNANEELDLQQLDGVSGGTWMDTVTCVVAAISAINGIQGVLGKAVDGIPPAPCQVPPPCQPPARTPAPKEARLK